MRPRGKMRGKRRVARELKAGSLALLRGQDLSPSQSAAFERCEWFGKMLSFEAAVSEKNGFVVYKFVPGRAI